MRPPIWNVEEVRGGFVVERRQFRLSLFCGRDGFWARFKETCIPLRTRSEAVELKEAEERREQERP